MSSKTMKVLLGCFLALFLAIGFFAAGIFLGSSISFFHDLGIDILEPMLGVEKIDIPPTPNATPPENAEEMFAPFWEAWNLVHNEYVDQPVDDTELMQGAIRGMMNALGDQHSSYMDPDEFLQANTHLEGEYEGIGAWVDPDAEFLTIVDPMPGSPAEEAGLKPGDQIIAVDGEDVTGMDGNLVIRKVLGPADSKVILTIMREGEDSFLDFEITRASIVIPSVESEMLEEEIAYVRIFDFGENTTNDLRAALETLLTEDPKGLIIDLRGNPGGFLHTSIEVASEFIPEGLILIERFGDGREEQYFAEEGGIATEIPLVVLINGGSASASEIVAGAIQDYNRGTLIGETSFGKGSVQSWRALSNGGAVRITIARWYTPKDRQIHEEGLTPDIEVLIDDELADDQDPQLEKAIEHLLNQ